MCSLQGRWDQLPCPEGEICQAEGGQVGCVVDPGIIGGGDAGVGGDGGPVEVDGRIVAGDGTGPGVQPATRGRSPVSRVEEPLDIDPGPLSQAVAALGGVLSWRLVPDQDALQVLAATGVATVDFTGAADGGVHSRPDRFCADYAACFQLASPEDCGALIAQQLETWGRQMLQCIADRLAAGEAGACAELAGAGQQCVAYGLTYADDAALKLPVRRVGGRMVGLVAGSFTQGAMVDVDEGLSASFEALGELRLREGAHNLDLSGDGRLAAYIGYFNQDEVIVRWDLASGVRDAQLPVSVGSTGAIALSSDGQAIALMRNGTGDLAQDGAIALWNLSEEKRIFSILPPEGGSFDQLVRLSPDGRTLAVATRRPNAVELWDLDARVIRQTLELGADYQANGIEFSPDGALVAVTYLNFDRPVTLWEVEGGQRVFTRAEGQSATFSPDGRILILPLELQRGAGIIRDR
ncbi:MAG: WD40 repeat domain-containing protein [bacterium]